MTNYYKILGVHKTATQEEIKTAYKNLVKKYHPDIYQGDKSFAEKKTSEINEAYEVLSNIEKRAEYDEEISPKSNYSYTPPQYSNSYDSYKNTQTSYENYKSKYNSVQADYNFTKDGSEHDYSTYANYYGNNRYSNYHRSKTPGANYSYNNSSKFSDKLYNNFNELNPKTQSKVFLLIVIIYLILFIFVIIQSSMFFNERKKQNIEQEIISNETITNTTLNNSEANNFETENNNLINNSYNSNTTNTENTVSEFDLYDFYTEDQLQEMYNQYTKFYNSEMTYNEFKDYVENLFVSIDSAY